MAVLVYVYKRSNQNNEQSEHMVWGKRTVITFCLTEIVEAFGVDSSLGLIVSAVGAASERRWS